MQVRVVHAKVLISVTDENLQILCNLLRRRNFSFGILSLSVTRITNCFAILQNIHNLTSLSYTKTDMVYYKSKVFRIQYKTFLRFSEKMSFLTFTAFFVPVIINFIFSGKM